MSYRDVQTGIGVGGSALGAIESIPGLGQFVTLLSDVVGAFGLASEQEAYNRMIWNYYATPVSQGGGYNPGTPASRRRQRLQRFRMAWNRGWF